MDSYLRIGINTLMYVDNVFMQKYTPICKYDPKFNVKFLTEKVGEVFSIFYAATSKSLTVLVNSKTFGPLVNQAIVNCFKVVGGHIVLFVLLNKLCSGELNTRHLNNRLLVVQYSDAQPVSFTSRHLNSRQIICKFK